MERKITGDEGKYKVQITGEINKLLYFDKPVVSTYEIAGELQIDKNAIFHINGKVITPGTLVKVEEEPVIVYNEVDTDS